MKHFLLALPLLAAAPAAAQQLTPAEAALKAHVVFLASDLSSYTSGTMLTIDGGLVHRAGLL